MSKVLDLIKTVVALASCTVLVGGCGALSVPAAAVNIGSVAYRALDRADISVALDRDAVRDELNRINTIAVWMGGESTTRPYGRIGDVGAVLGDNLVLELMNRGYSVYGHDRMPAGAAEEGSGESDHRRYLAAAREMGVDAVITGSVVAAQVMGRAGLLGPAHANTVVQSLSLRVTGTGDGRTLMIITVEYRTGQSPRIAAEGAAIILKAKLDDPDADIEKLIGIRGQFQGQDSSRRQDS